MRFNIITCPECKTIQDWANYIKRPCWERKAESNEDIDGSFNSYVKKASIYPEFSHLVAISMRVKGKDIMLDCSGWEKDLLLKVNEIFKKNKFRLGGFNIYGFAIPFLWKRMVINCIQPAEWLCISELKPRDMKDYIVDVMQIWKQTSFTCSLDLLSVSLLSENPWIDGYGEYVVSAMAQGNMAWCLHYCFQGMRYAERCFNAIMYHDQYESKEETKEVVEKSEWNGSADGDEKTLDEKKKEAEDIAKAKMENDEVLDDDEYDGLPF